MPTVRLEIFLSTEQIEHVKEMICMPEDQGGWGQPEKDWRQMLVGISLSAINQHLRDYEQQKRTARN